MSVRKTMHVKENSFRKLDDPFNDFTKKYVFYVKVCDVPEGIPMATNPQALVTKNLRLALHRPLKNLWRVMMVFFI